MKNMTHAPEQAIKALAECDKVLKVGSTLAEVVSSGYHRGHLMSAKEHLW